MREGFRTAKRYFTQYKGFRRKGLLRRSRKRTHPLKRDSSERRLFPYIQELIWGSLCRRSRTVTIPHIRRDEIRSYPRNAMAPNGGCVCICIYLQEVNEPFPLGSPIGGRGRICGTGIGASPCGGRTRARRCSHSRGLHQASSRLAGWAEHIYRLLDTQRLFLFLSYILYCYILSAIFILFYPYYPLQPAGKLRRFRMCGINLRAACIGGRRPCRAAGTV